MDFLDSIKKNTELIKDVCNHLVSVLYNTEIMILFPRLDYKSVFKAYEVFIVRPMASPITISLSSSGTTKSIINYENRKREYVDYNVTSQGMNISVSGAYLTDVWEESLVRTLKSIPYINITTTFSKYLVRTRFIDLYNFGCYYTFFSIPTGYQEIVTITSASLKDTDYQNAIEIDLSMRVLKTFDISNYDG